MSSQDFSSFKTKGSSNIIKVFGIGGGGSNAVNHMYKQGIHGVDFFVVNTDIQALQMSPVPNKIQIGQHLTQGLGAGAKPEVGRDAALESKEEIRNLLQNNTKMLFVTAGMGGGTGTGAAPVIAEIARDLGILTVGIVTAPFQFEGKPKKERAIAGIDMLKQYCDTVIVILNDRLRDVYGKGSMSEAFRQADNVLLKAAKSIAEIITVPGIINVDFQDVSTVMSRAGAAVMGSATAEGENRATRAAEGALTSPLLNNTDIFGAKHILLSIVTASEDDFQMEELEYITQYVQEQAGEQAEVIFGHAIDPDLGKAINVTIIATGFEARQEIPERITDNRRVFDLETNRRIPVKNRIVTSNPFNQANQPFEDNDFFEGQAGKSAFPKDRAFVAPEVPQAANNVPPVVKPEARVEKPVESVPPKGEPPKVVFDLNSDDYNNSEQKKKTELSDGGAKPAFTPRTQKAFSDLSSEEMNEYKLPAFARKNIKIDSNSGGANPSRFGVGGNDNVLGQNRFLHDNAD
jgi:cell division protein FtsZ